MIEPYTLDEIEARVFEFEHKPHGNPVLTQTMTQLVDEVRRLTHELADPRFMYAGSRVPRQAVMARNAEISALYEEIKLLKEKLEGTKK